MYEKINVSLMVLVCGSIAACDSSTEHDEQSEQLQVSRPAALERRPVVAEEHTAINIREDSQSRDRRIEHRSTRHGFNCEKKAALVGACNFKVVHDTNLAEGKTDLFAPTERCKDELASSFLFDPSWTQPGEKIAEAREIMLETLHVLFFAPLLYPADHSFIWPALPEKVHEGQLLSIGAVVVPATYDYAITGMTANVGLIDTFDSEVTDLVLSEYIDDPDPPHMDTYAGMITVNRYYLTGDLAIADAAHKYVFARSLYHELRHASGQIQHDGCSQYYGLEVECDDDLQHSAYGSGAQIMQSMVLGAIYGRIAGTNQRIESDSLINAVFMNNCKNTGEKVNDIGKWMSDNDAMDYCSSTEFVNAAVDLRRDRTPEELRRDPETADFQCSDPTVVPAARCGDGVVTFGEEECDDANLDNSDGCTDTCQLKDVAPQECPDEGCGTAEGSPCADIQMDLSPVYFDEHHPDGTFSATNNCLDDFDGNGIELVCVPFSADDNSVGVCRSCTDMEEKQAGCSCNPNFEASCGVGDLTCVPTADYHSEKSSESWGRCASVDASAQVPWECSADCHEIYGDEGYCYHGEFGGSPICAYNGFNDSFWEEDDEVKCAINGMYWDVGTDVCVKECDGDNSCADRNYPDWFECIENRCVLP